MVNIPNEFVLKTGRFYDFEQELHCYLLDRESGDDLVYFIVDPSRGMDYEISVDANLSDENRIKSAVLNHFMQDRYNSSPWNSSEKLFRFGWENRKRKIR